jgi:hypothetical protein
MMRMGLVGYDWAATLNGSAVNSAKPAAVIRVLDNMMTYRQVCFGQA